MEIYHNDCRKKQDEVKAYLTGNCFFKISNKTYWPGYYCEPTTDQVVYAHWNGPNGQRAKFSLVQKIKDFLYQVLFNCCHSDVSMLNVKIDAYFPSIFFIYCNVSLMLVCKMRELAHTSDVIDEQLLDNDD